MLGLGAATVVALVARRARALSPSGALAALPVGGAVFAGTGLRGSMVLLAYVASSSLLGRLPARGTVMQRRGNERDAAQVAANGGVPAALSLLVPAAGPHLTIPLWAAFGGSVAAATADTWATEIGTRAGGQPRSILSWQPVVRGTSGGVTAAGLAASVAGAGTIAVLTTVGFSQGSDSECKLPLAAAILIGGTGGSLVDSLIGASTQQVRFCVRCQRETELLIHSCGARTRHLRGQPWCDNDVVNALAAATGAAVAAIVCSLTGVTSCRPHAGSYHEQCDRSRGGAWLVEFDNLRQRAGRVRFPRRDSLRHGEPNVRDLAWPWVGHGEARAKQRRPSRTGPPGGYSG